MSKRKTGNGTWARQTIYLLGNLPFFWIIKVGISSRPDLRVQQIDKDNPGVDFLICKVERYGAYQWEQLHHFLMWPLRWRWFFGGTGKTERFFILAAIFTFVVFVLSGITDLIVVNTRIIIEIAAYTALLYGLYYLSLQYC